MRLLDAGPQIIWDLKDESEVVAVKKHSKFEISAVRHPTMEKVSSSRQRNSRQTRLECGLGSPVAGNHTAGSRRLVTDSRK